MEKFHPSFIFVSRAGTWTSEVPKDDNYGGGVEASHPHIDSLNFCQLPGRYPEMNPSVEDIKLFLFVTDAGTR